MKTIKKLSILLSALIVSSCASITPISDQNTSSTSNPAPTSSPITKKDFSFKVALIRGSGDIIPVPITEFIFRNYDLHSLLKDQIDNSDKPKTTNKKYELQCHNYLTDSICDIDFEKYNNDFENWYTSKLSIIKELQNKNSNNKIPFKIKTDLSGEGNINLEAGKWYVSGYYSNSTSLVSWRSVPIIISDDTKKIELTNDTATIVSKLTPTLGSSYYDKKEYYDSYSELFTELNNQIFESSLNNN